MTIGVPRERREAAARFEVGQRVRTAAWVKPPQYADRLGTVVNVNRRDGEVGVHFTRHTNEPTHWFLPTEVENVGDRRVTAHGRRDFSTLVL